MTEYITSPLFFIGPELQRGTCFSAASSQHFTEIGQSGAFLAIMALNGCTAEELAKANYTVGDIAAALDLGLLVEKNEKAHDLILWEDRNWSRFGYLIFSQFNYPYLEVTNKLDEYRDRVQFREEKLGAYMKQEPQPERYTFTSRQNIKLSKPGHEISLDWPTLFDRRSVRQFSLDPLGQDVLSEVLWSATNEARNARASQESSMLYFKLNSFYEWLELFVLVHNVADIEPGVYHYDIANHSLALVDEQHKPDQTLRLIQGQRWAEGGGVSLLAVADWYRYMWLYRLSRAYTNTLIQVGEFAQQVIQYGASLKLGLCVTPAVKESVGYDLLKIDESRFDPIYYIRMGIPS